MKKEKQREGGKRKERLGRPYREKKKITLKKLKSKRRRKRKKENENVKNK